MFCKAKSAKKKNNFFLRGNFRQFLNKIFHIWDHFFPLLFPKDSESLKILDIRLREVGAKWCLNGTSKVSTRTNRRTDGQTDRRTDISTYRKHPPRGPMLWKCMNEFFVLSSSFPRKETYDRRSYLIQLPHPLPPLLTPSCPSSLVPFHESSKAWGLKGPEVQRKWGHFGKKALVQRHGRKGIRAFCSKIYKGHMTSFSFCKLLLRLLPPSILSHICTCIVTDLSWVCTRTL